MVVGLASRLHEAYNQVLARLAASELQHSSLKAANLRF